MGENRELGRLMNQDEKIEAYLDFILKANESINLTRITDRDEALILHVEDSLVGLPEVNKAPDGLYGDLGTGGGFPGVPLAVVTGRDVCFVDSVKKKLAVVKQGVELLNLPQNVSFFDGRIEDLGREKAGEFSVLTARALSSLGSLLELASPLLKMNGCLVCYKAHIDEEENAGACKVSSLVGMKEISRREVILSDGVTLRTIVTYEKIGKSKIALPRRVGLAQKKPLALS